MKKSLWALVATSALVATFVITSDAGARPARQNRTLRDADHVIPPATLLTPTFAASTALHACQTTGFEPSEQAGLCQWPTNAWMCSPKMCTTPAPAGCGGACRATCPNLAGWYISGSSTHCNYPAVETSNPAPSMGSTQQLRFFRDAGTCQGGYQAAGFGPLATSACRQTAFSPAHPPYLPEPFTFSVDLAMLAEPGSAPFGSSFAVWALADNDASGLTAFYLYMHFYTKMYAYDFVTEMYETLGFMAGNGRYDHVEVIGDPCTGSLTYTFNGTPYVTSYGAGQAATIERFILGNQNIGSGHDVDNLTITRSGDTCPTTCGDGEVTLGAPVEQCDGEDDGCCPGRCIPAGQEGQCTCMPADNLYDGCPASARVLTNGDNGPFLHDGGLYSYTADTPFTSINTCGSDYDTEILWDLYNDCAAAVAYNDECHPTTFGGAQTPGDPSAPCFTAGAFNGLSCMCLPTEPGREYIFLVGEYGFTLVPPDCSSTQVSILKKTACGQPIEGGACCDRVSGTCSQVEDEADCSDDNQIFTFNKTCDMVECEAALGACCNTAPGAGGLCEDVTSAECATNQYTSWNKDVACDDYECNEVTGACCDGLTGTCTPDVLQAACNCSHCSWSVGASCSTVQCFPATGACCDTGSIDPTVATCTTTTLAACNCSKCTWTKGESCDNVVCDPNFTPIPTVSEWGLVIMALLLLVGGKVYFGRRQTAMA